MKKISVMLAGLSPDPDKGKMARLVGQAIVGSQDMSLCPWGLSETSQSTMPVDGVSVQLIPMGSFAKITQIIARANFDLIVDFTLPTAVNANAELYCSLGIPFVMGTTGGDRKKLVLTVEKSAIPAVIATNMAPPVVVFQEMIRFAAENFPGALDGFKLTIEESHQAAKVDVSGTAVSLLGFFAALGMPLKKEDIIMVRDSQVQKEGLGIPDQHLGGHGYHDYEMFSSDGTVNLGFKHNVLGRNVYVDGTMKAIKFLAGHPNAQGRVFTMVDVLKWVK